jgi:hypothetical protein
VLAHDVHAYAEAVTRAATDLGRRAERLRILESRLQGALAAMLRDRILKVGTFERGATSPGQNWTLPALRLRRGIPACAAAEDGAGHRAPYRWRHCGSKGRR